MNRLKKPVVSKQKKKTRASPRDTLFICRIAILQKKGKTMQLIAVVFFSPKPKPSSNTLSHRIRVGYSYPQLVDLCVYNIYIYIRIIIFIYHFEVNVGEYTYTIHWSYGYGMDIKRYCSCYPMTTFPYREHPSHFNPHVDVRSRRLAPRPEVLVGDVTPPEI